MALRKYFLNQTLGLNMANSTSGETTILNPLPVGDSSILYKYSKIYFVDPENGDDETGSVNEPDLPFLTVTAALEAAEHSALLYMIQGDYPPENNLLKNGVDQYWEDGASMSLTEGALFMDQGIDQSCNIYGKGIFVHQNQNALNDRDIINLSGATKLYIEAKHIDSIQQWNDVASEVTVKYANIPKGISNQANAKIYAYWCEVGYILNNHRSSNQVTELYDCKLTGNHFITGINSTAHIGGRSFGTHINTIYKFIRCEFELSVNIQTAFCINFQQNNSGCELHVYDCTVRGLATDNVFFFGHEAGNVTVGTYKFYFKNNRAINASAVVFFADLQIDYGLVNGYELRNEFVNEPFVQQDDTLNGFTQNYENKMERFGVCCVITNNFDIAAGGPLTNDGVTFNSYDRALLSGQTDPKQNGVYFVNTNGSWFRAADHSHNRDFQKGNTVHVAEGNSHGNTMWLLNYTDYFAIIGTTAFNYTELKT